MVGQASGGDAKRRRSGRGAVDAHLYLEALVMRLAAVFHADNERFNATRFIAACTPEK
jgi:hypothetical protein